MRAAGALFPVLRVFIPREVIVSRRREKQEILALLAERQALAVILARLEQWPALAVVNALFSALCRTEEFTRWRGISCMGASVARLACEDMEAARVVMRRFLWSLNDESGGIGWGAPESMAEAMSRHEGLAQEYAHLLLSYLREDGPELFQDGNFLEHPLLQQGVLWGLVRLSGCRRDLLLQLGAGPELLPFVRDDRATARALAALALGRLGQDAALPALQALAADDTAPVRLYTAEGEFADTTVAACAAQALELLHGQ